MRRRPLAGNRRAPRNGLLRRAESKDVEGATASRYRRGVYGLPRRCLACVASLLAFAHLAALAVECERPTVEPKRRALASSAHGMGGSGTSPARALRDADGTGRPKAADPDGPAARALHAAHTGHGAHHPPTTHDTHSARNGHTAHDARSARNAHTAHDARSARNTHTAHDAHARRAAQTAHATPTTHVTHATHDQHDPAPTRLVDARGLGAEVLPTCSCGCQQTRGFVGGGGSRLGPVVPGVILSRLPVAAPVGPVARPVELAGAPWLGPDPVPI